MKFDLRIWVLLPALLAWLGCDSDAGRSARSEINVAAAANLVGTIEPLARRFEEETGIRAVVSIGATASLTSQIENGAPFDVFLSADVKHIDRLIVAGAIAPESKAVYARGQLVVWHPSGRQLVVRGLEDLTAERVKVIALAKPEVAPYGAASVEALKAAGIWQAVEPKAVYGQNVIMAKQFAESGNADVALTSLSSVIDAAGQRLAVDPHLHAPIDQALGIVAQSGRKAAVRSFVDFLLGGEGQESLAKKGYRKVSPP